jgi:hypothetical protein
MKVRFYRQRPTGSEDVGALVLRDGLITPEPPDSIALNNILAKPLIAYLYEENDRRIRIDPKTQPEKFLKALPTAIHGTYFWAGKVED